MVVSSKFDVRNNVENECFKYDYFEFLEHNKGRDNKTIDQHILAIHEFEVTTDFSSFTSFNKDQAIEFKNHLQNKKNKRNGEPISISTYCHYCNYLKTFFNWLIDEKKEFAKIKKSEISYFNPKQNELNKAKATNYQESHEIVDILKTIRKMPEKTIIQQRDKAIFSLALLTDARISSIQTATIGSIRLLKEHGSWAFIQNPKQQNTKYAKNITTFFVGNCEDVTNNILKWKEYLISEGFKNNDYLFPKIDKPFKKNSNSQSQYIITKGYIRSEQIIRDITKNAYIENNLKPIKFHNIRHSIERFVRRKYDSVDLNITLATNFGHDNKFATIIQSYGADPLQRQAELIKSINFEK